MPTLQEMEAAMGSRPGDPNWNPDCDLDNSGNVDGLDMWRFYNPTEAEQIAAEVETWEEHANDFFQCYGTNYGHPAFDQQFDYGSDGVVGPDDRDTFLAASLHGGASLTDRAKAASFGEAYGKSVAGGQNTQWRIYDFDNDGVIGPADLQQFYLKAFGITVPDYPWAIPVQPVSAGLDYNFNSDQFVSGGFYFSPVWGVDDTPVCVPSLATIEANQAALAADDSVLLAGGPPIPLPPPNPFEPLMPGNSIFRPFPGGGGSWIVPSWQTPGWVGPPGWRNPNSVWPPGYPHPSIPGVYGPPTMKPPSWQGDGLPLLPGDYYWDPVPEGWPGGGTVKSVRKK
jgi:hypothetical protein